MTSRKVSKEVERLQAIANDLERQLLKARERLHAELCAGHPFQPGSVVLVDRARKGGFVARVERLVVKYGDVEMEVAKRLKSGNFSTYTTHVSTFQTVEPIDQGERGENR